MLSTITIISVFTEIFAAGILIAGAYSFCADFIVTRKRKDITLGALFFFFASFVSLTVISQMMYNIGRPISELMIVHKLIYADIAICCFLIWIFLLDKFGWAGTPSAKGVSFALFLAILATFVSIAVSRVDLIYRADVIEPVVNFYQMVPSRVMWVALWAILGIVSIIKAVSSNVSRRNLLLLTGTSSFLIVAAYACITIYVNTADPSFLIASWASTLFASMGLLIAEVVPEDSPLALEPLSLFRTRILYKLILIFVLLIAIILEVTTLATLNISRDSLIQAIWNNQRSLAENIAGKIEYGASIDKLVQPGQYGNMTVYVVDENSKIIFHPQRTKIGYYVRRQVFGEGAGLFDQAMEVDSGSFSYSSNDQIEYVTSFAKVGGKPLRVFVEEPKWDAYSEIRKVETYSLLFSIAGIVLTVLVGIFFARSIEKPIRRVIAGTEAVRRGNLNQRIEVSSSDEIGQLASAFNKMTADLKESQDHLIEAEKLAALGTMAAGMAHEIKNPLVSLRTFTQLLQQKFDDPEYRRKFSAIVPQEIERINKIAESLLKFGKPTKPEMGRVNVVKVLEEALALLENECKKNNIRVTTKFAPVPDITADPMQLNQAFVNIVLNAIQAMPKGGELTLKTDVGEVIRLGRFMHKGVLRHEGDRGVGEWGEAEESKEEMKPVGFEHPIPVVFVEITDTGVGIPEDNLKSLFDPFFTTKVEGTGMGLPITLRIVEDHKGSIKVRSQVGRGTTFIVTLPQKLDEA